jgi:hypothetical protein
MAKKEPKPTYAPTPKATNDWFETLAPTPKEAREDKSDESWETKPSWEMKKRAQPTPVPTPYKAAVSFPKGATISYRGFVYQKYAVELEAQLPYYEASQFVIRSIL